MIESFRIQNFKSIVDQTIELGRFNVFIGENGGGKTNVLEALALGSVAVSAPRREVTAELLTSAGIRLARSGMMRSAFGDRNSAPIKLSWRVETSSISAEFTVFEQPKGPWLGEANVELDGKSDLLSRHELQRIVNLVKAQLLQLERSGAPIDAADLATTKRTVDELEQSHRRRDQLEAATTFSLFTPTLTALRGLSLESARRPLGMHGEGLDVHLAQLPDEKLARIKELAKGAALS